MNAQEWNTLVALHAPVFGAFLQSYEWGEFQASLGREVRRVYAEEGGKVMVAQAIKLPLPLGKSYWSIPKGPLGTMSEQQMIAALRRELGSAMFYRMEPALAMPKLPRVKDMQPSCTLIVDLEQTEEEILAAMKSKTRYNARLAEKKGVVSKFVDVDDYAEDFALIMQQTAVRDGIRLFPMSYYIAQTKIPGFRLAMAFYEGRPLAANIISDFAGMRTYVNGATSNLHRDVMPQYHLHQFLMLDAKRSGLTEFDFWGIAPEGASADHAWAGITRYKLGYGGAIAEAPGTIELPIEHMWYGLYRFMKSIRK